MPMSEFLTGAWLPIRLLRDRSLNLLERVLLAEIAEWPGGCDGLNTDFADAYVTAEANIQRAVLRLHEKGLIEISHDGRGQRYLKITDFAASFWLPLGAPEKKYPDSTVDGSDGCPKYNKKRPTSVEDTASATEGSLPGSDQGGTAAGEPGDTEGTANDTPLARGETPLEAEVVDQKMRERETTTLATGSSLRLDENSPGNRPIVGLLDPSTARTREEIAEARRMLTMTPVKPFIMDELMLLEHVTPDRIAKVSSWRSREKKGWGAFVDALRNNYELPKTPEEIAQEERQKEDRRAAAEIERGKQERQARFANTSKPSDEEMQPVRELMAEMEKDLTPQEKAALRQMRDGRGGAR